MSGEGLPADVRAFITECIASSEQLEILALFRKEPKREWSAEQVAAELKTNAATTGARLDGLSDKGVVARRKTPEGNRYLFGYPGPDLVARVDRLLAFATTHRVAVYEAVYSRAESSIRVWADAFRLRK